MIIFCFFSFVQKPKKTVKRNNFLKITGISKHSSEPEVIDFFYFGWKLHARKRGCLSSKREEFSKWSSLLNQLTFILFCFFNMLFNWILPNKLLYLSGVGVNVGVSETCDLWQEWGVVHAVCVRVVSCWCFFLICNGPFLGGGYSV